MRFDDMLNKLKGREPFAFSRWGDGEWSAVLDVEGENCDGHRYFPDMSRRLREVLMDNPPYIFGMQSKAQQDMGLQINAWIHRHMHDREWADADILHDASIAGRMSEFFDACSVHEQIVFVGCYESARILFSSFCIDVRTPKRNAWLAYESTKGRIIDQFFYQFFDGENPTIILLSCGMMANVLIHDLWQMFGNTVTLIDCGSVFDPYLGVASRRYHKQILERENAKT